MTSAHSKVVKISDDIRFVRRAQAGQATVGAVVANVAAVLAIGAIAALGASFEMVIDQGAGSKSVASVRDSQDIEVAPPALTSVSEAYETTDMGLAIFPYGELDDKEVNYAEWGVNMATLPLEIAGSQQNREAWLTGTIETGYGFAQLVGGGFNLLAQQDGVAGLVGKAVTGAVNVPAQALAGKKPFDGETGVEMFRAFISMADFENNGAAGGMGRLGMMMGGSIWNEFMVMGSRNRENAAYALGAWTIDIVPWAFALRGTSHAAQRMGRSPAAIAKWRTAEVAKDASKFAKQSQPSFFQRFFSRFSRSGDDAANLGTSTTAVTAAATVGSASAAAEVAQEAARPAARFNADALVVPDWGIVTPPGAGQLITPTTPGFRSMVPDGFLPQRSPAGNFVRRADGEGLWLPSHMEDQLIVPSLESP